MTIPSLSDTVARVFDQGQKDTEALKVYMRTINRIDDFFEYTNESESDRRFIHEQLDKLTKQLEKIYNTG